MKDNSIEEIINELSKTESLSEKIRDDTERQRDVYAESVKNDFLEFELKLQKEIEEQLSAIKDEARVKVNEDIEIMRTQTDMKINELQEKFDKVYMQEAKDIVEAIIKE